MRLMMKKMIPIHNSDLDTESVSVANHQREKRKTDTQSTRDTTTHSRRREANRKKRGNEQEDVKREK